MGQFLSSQDLPSFYLSYKVLAFGVVAPVLLGVLCFNWLKSDGSDDSTTITIAYDDDDDLDEKTIISLVDKINEMGKFKQIRDEFDRLRKQLLRGYNRNTQLPLEINLQYIDLCWKYEQILQQTLDQNKIDLADLYNLQVEDIDRAQLKYINETNSHKVLNQKEILSAKIPPFLTQEYALEIKHEMEAFAYAQLDWYMQYFQNERQIQTADGDYSQRFNSSRRLQAEDIINSSALYFEADDANPEHIGLKAATISKYLTIDLILEKEYKITETQLKRVLYRTVYDELTPNNPFKRLYCWLFNSQ